ncbi:MAG: hypothetical protein P4K80_03165 [Acidobacteriaceae bacterium]|nr:hypothetical protein [Acidobacteriaceae bacterium]
MPISRSGHSLRTSLALALRVASLVLLASLVPAIYAQAPVSLASDASATPGADPKPAPELATRGFNATLSTSSQHDSSAGWSSVLTPNAIFVYNKHLSANASIPDFVYINVYANVGTKAKPVYAYQSKSGVVGDTSLAFHYDALTSVVEYSNTVSLGLPSGNTNYGLGAGQVTYNINNHFDKDLDFFTPEIELGFGDSTSLVHQTVRKSYIAVGSVASFQAGASFNLPMNCSFDADAYESLPLTQDLIYSTTGKGKKKVTTSTNKGPGEDNGFDTSLDIPLERHITLTGAYSRSLRNHDDVVGFSLNFLMIAPPKAKKP